MKRWIFGILFFIAIPTPTHAEIIISEIAWMGTDLSSSDEWIELHNSGEDSVDLTGWTVEWDTDGDSPKIVELEGEIAASGYYLLERTDDQTVSDITADLIYVGSLGNSGEHLYLKEGDTTRDEVNGTDGWPAGDNSSKATMQLVGDTWQSEEPTPRRKNSAAEEVDNDTTPASPDIPAQLSRTSITVAPREQQLYLDPGDDRDVVVGEPVELKATLFTNGGATVRRAATAWTLGDGFQKAGMNITHTYKHPGEYLAFVKAGFGGEEAEGRVVIKVRPLLVEIVDAERDRVVLKNNDDMEVNLGGFFIKDKENMFRIPGNTIVLPNREVVFDENVLGFKIDDNSVRILFPSQEEAYAYEIEEEEEVIVAKVETPKIPEPQELVASVIDIATPEEEIKPVANIVNIHKRGSFWRELVAFPRKTAIYIRELLF